MSKRKSKRVATGKSGCDSVNDCAASPNLEEIFGTLLAAEKFIAVWKPTPYATCCECGSCKLTRTLNAIREYRRHND